tara:strand:+ start:799 stop:972 length:174 start_codon:yes stop_codon:yes gene_type:complete
MSILFEHSGELTDRVGSFDDMQDQPPAFSDQLTYWALLFTSACITTLGFWKLIELLL